MSNPISALHKSIISLDADSSTIRKLALIPIVGLIVQIWREVAGRIEINKNKNLGRYELDKKCDKLISFRAYGYGMLSDIALYLLGLATARAFVHLARTFAQIALISFTARAVLLFTSPVFKQA